MAVIVRLEDGLETMENRTLFDLLINLLPSCVVELGRAIPIRVSDSYIQSMIDKPFVVFRPKIF